MSRAELFFIIAAVAAIMFGGLFFLSSAQAQDVTHCQNLQTGEIIVVRKGMPCPFPTAEI